MRGAEVGPVPPHRGHPLLAGVVEVRRALDCKCDDRDVHYTVMPRLPVALDFRIYGLSDAYDGFRWLSHWHPRESPVAPLPDGPITIVGLHHGRHDHDGVTVSTGHGFRRRHGVPLDDWQTGSVTIGGVDFASRRLDDSLTLIDLPTGRIFVTEHGEARGTPWQLVDVSARLDDYVAGRQELADHEHREVVRWFRVSRDRYWSTLRAIVRGRGIQLNRAVVADMFWDLPEFQDRTELDRTLFILVSRDSRVFQFTYAKGLPGNPPSMDIEDWQDITTTWHQQGQFVAQIQWALDYVVSEQ